MAGDKNGKFINTYHWTTILIYVGKTVYAMLTENESMAIFHMTPLALKVISCSQFTTFFFYRIKRDSQSCYLLKEMLKMSLDHTWWIE